jgi:hypothetical protein
MTTAFVLAGGGSIGAVRRRRFRRFMKRYTNMNAVRF